MSKARTLANLISDNAELADGQISVAEVVGAAPLANPSFTGNITVSGNVDGRDIAADGTKLDGVEASADVTDAANVTAAGALMDSELTNIAAIKALNQGVATTDEVAFDNTTLNAIAKDISDTAVDVFVYDTSKDSDGGAWRKRTQHTSWYNETLNTATRGSRKEFPAVAVIVAESNQVTIYDGDDPDMPMWMVFNAGGGYPSTYALGEAGWGGPNAVVMLNGTLCTPRGAGGLPHMSFIDDACYRISTDGLHSLAGGVAARNSGMADTISSSSKAIVNGTCNDVAMTVLPNAPIDYATGLPVPTIAVATEGGVSVIKDDGTVVDITNSSAYDRSLSVSFTHDNKIAFAQHSNSSGSFAWYLVYDIPSSDKSHTVNTRDEAVSWFETRRDNTNGDFHILITPSASNNGDAIQEAVTLPNNELAVTCDYGVTKLAEDRPSGTSALGAYITSDYNTGWMNGDIKLATLSDTDDTDVTGAELVTNGTFASDVSGWTVTSNGTFTHSSGSAILEQVSGANASAYQSITTVVGERYVASCDVTGISSRILIGTVSSSGNVASSGFLSATTITVDFVATSTTTFFSVQSGGTLSGQQTTVDNISVRLAEEDRSVNGNGLQVFGSIIKNPVATGADLVAYSGFSGSNYLRQPYNPDLNFGTGSWSINCWFKIASGANTAVMLSWRASDGSAPLLQVYQTNTSMSFDASDGPVNAGLSTSTTYRDDQWHMLTFLARGPSLREAYVDGKFVGSSTTTVGPGFTGGSDHEFKIGHHYDGAYPYSGSVALVRLSATAPSPEQIAKIYNDEKVLFQENAKATLYGTSDAVTALAHDDTTDLLHVGTSAGRSVFQGLRRVDNTTTAVGATISASNGLVAED